MTPPVRIGAADFDFLELGSIRDRVNAVLATEPGLVFAGISVLVNRADVGVQSAAVDRVSAALRRVGVPLAAIQLTGVAGGLQADGLQMEPSVVPKR